MNSLPPVSDRGIGIVTRRPGLFSVVVLAGLLSGCQEPESTADLINKRDDYRSHRDNQAEYLRAAEEQGKKLDMESGVAREMEGRITEMYKQEGALITEIGEIESRLNPKIALLDSYRKWGSQHGTSVAAGESLGSVALRTGSRLEGATVTQVREDALGLRHSSGHRVLSHR